jgi:hypothetical protein
MITKDELTEWINGVDLHTQKMLLEIEHMKVIDATHREHIKHELAEYVYSGLIDLSNSLKKVDVIPEFVEPLIVAAISYGMIAGEVGQGNLNSELKKQYGRQRQKGTEKQKALDEIEKEFYLVENQFKRYGFTAQFTREMLAKYDEIKDPKTIADLVKRLKTPSAR